MGSRSGYPGVSSRKLKTRETLYINFSYRGVRCREPLPGLNAELKKDWDYALGLKREIERKISLDHFFYADYFPKSPKLKNFGNSNKSGLTVLHYLNEYIEDAEKRGLSLSTIRGYEGARNNLAPLHDIPVASLTSADLKNFIKSSSVSIKTMRNRLSLLNSALNEAVIEGVIQFNPCTAVNPGKYMKNQEKVNTRGQHEDVDPFRPAEIEAILNACRYEQERNLLQFAFYSGLRSSELAGLKWIDVDFFNEEVRVTEAVIRDPKNKTSITKGTKTSAGRRVIALMPEALAALKAQKAFTELKSECVFEEPRQLAPLTGADQIRKNIWLPVIKRSKVRYRNPYQTRHTFATMMISRGENLWWIAEQMGHDGPEMLFRHYGSYIKEHDSKTGNSGHFKSGRN
ncbi:site-specific integrase [Pseudoalteromonas sp. R3]|uniref:site-specific integrase n=1 Tax=Pseudoalteromonas sp. R3 TaxID=1709477 RepID=UPI0009EB0AE3|nr:site-specific integrase [Pseudoalteromonas sp. R3]AZZ98792.1 site-specific integrase [Pseudoalteromonas sp. R3]